MKAKMVNKLLVLMVFVFFWVAATVFAVPNSPLSITTGTPERGFENTTNGFLVEAQAGNVTQLTINDSRITSRWQGYFGNISGKITLDDANNNTLYDWNVASPTGEIFASNESTVTWGDIDCFNFTGNHSSMNLTTLENMIGAGFTDIDGVDETFNETLSGSLSVGGVDVAATPNLCALTYLYVNDNYQATSFQEVILTDNNSVIFTSILEQDTTGYDGNSWDFQMIVGEDGDVAAATGYYFFVELA